MAACGFADYEHLFKEHNISGDRLLQLTSEDLRDIGFVTVGDRLVMQQEIAGLRAGRRIAWRSNSFELGQERMVTSKSDRSDSESRLVGWNTNEERKSEYLKSAEEVSKQKDQKSRRKALRKHRSSEDLRSLRSKICQALRLAAAREDGCMGHAVLKVWQSYVQQQVKDRQRLVEDLTPSALCGLRGVCARRAVLSQLAALRAWAAVVVLRRHEVELKAQEEKASLRSTSALAVLRNELRAVRWQGHRAAFRLAQQRALLAQLAPFNAWRQLSQEARHAARLRCELESVNLNTVSALGSARAEVKGVRHLARRAAEVTAWRGGLLCLAPVFNAWSRQVCGVASRRLRPGEVLLNSGQAAKRAQQQLQEARAQHVEQLSVLEKELAELKKEVSDARMSAAASVRREARVENIARRHELAAKRGEELAALLACMKAWMGEVVLSRSTAALRKEAQERLAESLARQRLESRGALHQAWSDAAQASRRAAALERRLHETRSGSGGDIVPYDASRPSTALAIEERLRRSDAAREAPESEPPPRAEVLLVDPARDEIRAAREGRKGLFIAALKQQAKYWQAEAFNAWCRVFLQDRCQKLQALLDMRKKACAPATPRSTRSRP